MKLNLLLIAIFSMLCFSCGRNSGIDYDVAIADSTEAVVLLKGDAGKQQLAIIADSCFDNTGKKEKNSFSVLFYYRPDWKGKIYYAGKLWLYNFAKGGYIEQKLDITGIKGVR